MPEKVLITTRFHPNEEVAKEMANKLAKNLREKGVDVIVVDIETERTNNPNSRYGRRTWFEEMDDDEMRRFVDREKVLKLYPDRIAFDAHDSDVEVAREINERHGTTIGFPALIEEGENIVAVEFGAVYVPQEIEEIRKISGKKGFRTAGYFSERSDVKKSDRSGLLGDEVVEKAAKLILTRMKK